MPPRSRPAASRQRATPGDLVRKPLKQGACQSVRDVARGLVRHACLRGSSRWYNLTHSFRKSRLPFRSDWNIDRRTGIGRLRRRESRPAPADAPVGSPPPLPTRTCDDLPPESARGSKAESGRSPRNARLRRLTAPASHADDGARKARGSRALPDERESSRGASRGRVHAWFSQGQNGSSCPSLGAPGAI